jgi:hypothetical protein
MQKKKDIFEGSLQSPCSFPELVYKSFFGKLLTTQLSILEIRLNQVATVTALTSSVPPRSLFHETMR